MLKMLLNPNQPTWNYTHTPVLATISPGQLGLVVCPFDNLSEFLCESFMGQMLLLMPTNGKTLLLHSL